MTPSPVTRAGEKECCQGPSDWTTVSGQDTLALVIESLSLSVSLCLAAVPGVLTRVCPARCLTGLAGVTSGQTGRDSGVWPALVTGLEQCRCLKGVAKNVTFRCLCKASVPSVSTRVWRLSQSGVSVAE